MVTRLVLLVWTLLLGFALTGCSCASEEPEEEGPRPIREVPAGAVFYLGDHQGSPVVVTNAQGEVIRETAYHPYGSTRYERGDSTDPHAYVGNEADQGSGLSDFHARPFREQAGVFLAPDPVAVFQPESVLGEPERLSAYGYCAGDAINRSDPSGEFWPGVAVAVGVGIMLAAQYANAPTRTNPETKHKDAAELALEATATGISVSSLARGAAVLARAGTSLGRRLLARAARPQSAVGGFEAVAPVKAPLQTVGPSAAVDRTARMGTAYRFYRDEAGFDPASALKHMRGIDLKMAVDAVTFRVGAVYAQHVRGARVGQYFGSPGASASSLGISPAGRTPTLFVVKEPTRALESTAAPVMDTWTIPGRPYPASGGGRQFFVPTPDGLKANYAALQ